MGDDPYAVGFRAIADGIRDCFVEVEDTWHTVTPKMQKHHRRRSEYVQDKDEIRHDRLNSGTKAPGKTLRGNKQTRRTLDRVRQARVAYAELCLNKDMTGTRAIDRVAKDIKKSRKTVAEYVEPIRAEVEAARIFDKPARQRAIQRLKTETERVGPVLTKDRQIHPDHIPVRLARLAHPAEIPRALEALTSFTKGLIDD
jgi:hypothetical protein